MSNIGPFTATGTGSFPGHRFFLTTPGNITNVLHRIIVGEYPENLYVYNGTDNLAILNPEERKQYDNWRDTLAFHEIYLNFTGRSYLARYLRDPPKHFMWRADYFGQEHWIESKETHFISTPTEEELKPIAQDSERKHINLHQRNLLSQYRTPNQSTMNMTLTVLSVAPRVFEIPNFLSEVEVKHVVKVRLFYTQYL